MKFVKNNWKSVAITAVGVLIALTAWHFFTEEKEDETGNVKLSLRNPMAKA